MDSLIRPADVTVTRAAHGDKMSNVQMTPGGATFRTDSLTALTDVQPGRGHGPGGRRWSRSSAGGKNGSPPETLMFIIIMYLQQRVQHIRSHRTNQDRGEGRSYC